MVVLSVVVAEAFDLIDELCRGFVVLEGRTIIWGCKILLRDSGERLVFQQ